MAHVDEVEIRVTVDGEMAMLDKEWVTLFWVKGPSNIRWIFETVPDSAVSAQVEFLTKLPPKYTPINGFIAGSPVTAMHQEPSSAGTRVRDIVTTGNLRKKGYFVYDLQVYDASGVIIARADPGGTNDEDAPPSPHP